MTLRPVDLGMTLAKSTVMKRRRNESPISHRDLAADALGDVTGGANLTAVHPSQYWTPVSIAHGAASPHAAWDRYDAGHLASVATPFHSSGPAASAFVGPATPASANAVHYDGSGLSGGPVAHPPGTTFVTYDGGGLRGAAAHPPAAGFVTYDGGGLHGTGANPPGVTYVTAGGGVLVGTAPHAPAATSVTYDGGGLHGTGANPPGATYVTAGGGVLVGTAPHAPAGGITTTSETPHAPPVTTVTSTDHPPMPVVTTAPPPAAPTTAAPAAPAPVITTGHAADVWLNFISGAPAPSAAPSNSGGDFFDSLFGDPLLLDLHGNGVQLTSVQDGVLFDINGDGILDQTAWTQALGENTNAWLVRDDSHDGGAAGIQSGRELFGDQHGDANGFERLRAFDSNHDNVFDANDAAFNEMQLWQDVNHNGVSEANELSTLADHGVTSINLTPTAPETHTEDGSRMLEGSFTHRP